MSALPPNATLKAFSRMSALGQKRTSVDFCAFEETLQVVVAHETSAALRSPNPIYSQMILEKRASTKNQVCVK
jgi:hypothetical protein